MKAKFTLVGLLLYEMVLLLIQQYMGEESFVTAIRQHWRNATDAWILIVSLSIMIVCLFVQESEYKLDKYATLLLDKRVKLHNAKIIDFKKPKQ